MPPAATVPASVTAGNSPAFRYSFDDGDAAGWTGDPANWTVQPDETGDFFYEGAAAPGNDTASELPNKATMSTWRNYAVHFLMRAHQEGNNPDLPEFWLTTRAPLAEVAGCGFYNTYFDYRNQVITLAKGGDASCGYVPIESNGYPQLAVGEWYDVVVAMQADRLQVTVDGELLIDAEDSDVQQGYVYFNVGPGAIVQFDDVEVYKLDE